MLVEDFPIVLRYCPKNPAIPRGLGRQPSRIRTGDCGFRARKTPRPVFVSVAKLGGSVSLPIRLPRFTMSPATLTTRRDALLASECCQPKSLTNDVRSPGIRLSATPPSTQTGDRCERGCSPRDRRWLGRRDDSEDVAARRLVVDPHENEVAREAEQAGLANCQRDGAVPRRGRRRRAGSSRTKRNPDGGSRSSAAPGSQHSNGPCSNGLS